MSTVRLMALLDEFAKEYDKGIFNDEWADLSFEIAKEVKAIKAAKKPKVVKKINAGKKK